MTPAIEPFSFVHSNRRVVYAWDAIAQLPEIVRSSGCKRPALVLDRFFLDSPLRDQLQTMLHPLVVHGIPAEEPDVATIEACRDALAASDSDLIVVVGGGSAMDAVKVARMLLANPGSAEALAGMNVSMRSHASLLIAIPTTAGTGSEVSESAIAGLPGHDIKLIWRSPDMTPQVAILDPALTVSCPPAVTAYSGYDAVTHAVEAYVSRAASVMTDPYALGALRLLAQWLPIAYCEPDHLEARGACLIAATQAAIAFNSANLGLAHAIAAPLGAQFGVAHGLGNALALPAVTAFNEPVLGAKGEAMAQALGATSAADGLARLRSAVGLNYSLDQFVPTDVAREALAIAAMKSGQVKMNPRAANLVDMRAIIAAMRVMTTP